MREGLPNGQPWPRATQAQATAPLVDFAQGTNPAAIIGTQRRSEDTNALIAIRHFADPTIRPIIDDVILANNGAGDQIKRLYKIARGAEVLAGRRGERVQETAHAWRDAELARHAPYELSRPGHRRAAPLSGGLLGSKHPSKEAVPIAPPPL